MTANAKTLDNIQALRGIAAFVVTLLHASVLSIDYADKVFYTPSVLIGKAGVDLFFVISGFVMAYTTAGTFGQKGSATYFAISRISRIYPPYWVLTFLVFLYWLHNPTGVNSKSSGVYVLESFLLLPAPGQPLVPVAWTLVFEMFFYLIFWLLLLIGNRRLLVPAMLAWAALAMANTLGMLSDKYFTWPPLLVTTFNLEFIAGVLLAKCPRYKALGWPAVLLGAAIFLGEGLYLELTHFQEIGFTLQATVLMFLPPSALLVYGALSLESGGHRAPQWLARIGDGSYSLYLVHILVLHAVYRVLRGHVGASTPWPTLVLLYVALVAGACVVAYVFRRYVEQPLSSRARKLLFAWSARLPSFGR